MKLTIHRGAKEIGGSCVELTFNKSRIVLDLGIPLVGKDGSRFNFDEFEGLSGKELVKEGILPNISGFYKWDTSRNKVDGLMISHSHLDHYGFAHFVHKDIKLYMGKGTKRIIDLTNTFIGGKQNIQNYAYHKSGEPYTIGTFTVTPYLMDHSAFDSYAFLIEAGSKKIVYTGDFREHGRKSKAFYWFLKQVPENIDALLMEGSLFGREKVAQKTEEDIEQEIFSHLKSTKNISFCITSGQNIDRLVSFYKAAARARRYFVLDVYTANVLYALKDIAKLPYPSESFKKIRVFYPYRLCNKLRREGKVEFMTRFRDFRITKKEISESPDKVLMIIRQSMISDLARISNIRHAKVIYSMWEGYLEDKSMGKLLLFMKNRDMDMVQLHTSGHANINTLKKVVHCLKPKHVIPIHTFHPERYAEISEKVLLVRDGKQIKI